MKDFLDSITHTTEGGDKLDVTKDEIDESSARDREDGKFETMKQIRTLDEAKRAYREAYPEKYKEYMREHLRELRKMRKENEEA